MNPSLNTVTKERIISRSGIASWLENLVTINFIILSTNGVELCDDLLMSSARIGIYFSTSKSDPFSKMSRRLKNISTIDYSFVFEPVYGKGKNAGIIQAYRYCLK